MRFIGFLLALWAIAIAMVQNPNWLRPVHEVVQGFLVQNAWSLWMPVIRALQMVR
jgi:hypothetical protein